jgi:hypothetical protein
MANFNCSEFCKKAEICDQVVSSNGHSTWCTPLYKTDDWATVCNYDFEGISAPYIMESGKPACNGFEPNENFNNSRLCQCGSGINWVNCNAQNEYCG